MFPRIFAIPYHVSLYTDAPGGNSVLMEYRDKYGVSLVYATDLTTERGYRYDADDREGFAWNWWHKGGLHVRSVSPRFTAVWQPNGVALEEMDIGYLGWMEIDDCRFATGTCEGAD